MFSYAYELGDEKQSSPTDKRVHMHTKTNQPADEKKDHLHTKKKNHMQMKKKVTCIRKQSLHADNQSIIF